MGQSIRNFWLIGLLAAAPLTARADAFQDGLAALQSGDHAGALSFFHHGADSGDARSQYRLAQMYRQGDSAPRDASQALAWYRKAADQGNPGAQFALGLIYRDGLGARADAAAARTWLEKAAGQGYAAAEAALGRLAGGAPGQPQDIAAAFTWCSKAADQGDADGQFCLAELYSTPARSARERFHDLMDSVYGRGKWRETGGYRSNRRENELRAEGAGTVGLGERSRHSMGTPDAPGAYDIVVDGTAASVAARRLRGSGARLARILVEEERGTQGPHLHIEPLMVDVVTTSRHGGGGRAAGWANRPDYASAAQWYRKAADQGHAEARTKLAVLYRRGLAVPPTEVVAAEWQSRAASPAVAAFDAATRSTAAGLGASADSRRTIISAEQ